MDVPWKWVTMDVRKVSNKVSVIDVIGELNGLTEDALMTAYNQASDERIRAIVLNFEGVEYMNNSGLGLLVELLSRVNLLPSQSPDQKLREDVHKLVPGWKIRRAASIR